MGKMKIKSFPYLLPKPVAIVGALVENKPNFLTIADISTTGYKIPSFYSWKHVQYCVWWRASP